MNDLTPMLFTTLKGYNGRSFLSDLIAGVTVAIFTLPVSIALAIASNLAPEAGLITSFIAGLIAGLLGGSKLQITGPTAAFAPLIASIVSAHGTDGLILATVLAGIMLILVGLFRLGDFLKFIPTTITSGFSLGIAIAIIIAQLSDFTGLKHIGGSYHSTLEILSVTVSGIHAFNINAFLVGVFSLLILVFLPKIKGCSKIPATLVAVIVSAIVVYLFKLNVYTIGDLYKVNAKLPTPVTPKFSWELLTAIIPIAFAIATHIAIESLHSAETSSNLIGGKFRPNIELVAQGTGNIFSVLFGGMPASGAQVRTITAIKDGGKTPITAIIHSIILFIALTLFMPFTAYIPMPTVAAVLFIVAYNTCGFKRVIKTIKTAPVADVMVLLVTAVITVVFDLVVAIIVGVILACFMFMKSMSNESFILEIDEETAAHLEHVEKLEIPPHIRVYEVHGPMFFGSVEALKDIDVKGERAIIFHLRGVTHVDSTAMEIVEEFADRCVELNVKLIFSATHSQPYRIMKRSGLVNKLGEESYFKTLKSALDFLKEANELAA